MIIQSALVVWRLCARCLFRYLQGTFTLRGSRNMLHTPCVLTCMRVCQLPILIPVWTLYACVNLQLRCVIYVHVVPRRSWHGCSLYAIRLRLLRAKLVKMHKHGGRCEFTCAWLWWEPQWFWKNPTLTGSPCSLSKSILVICESPWMMVAQFDWSKWTTLAKN